MARRLTIIGGGARSGKSRFAEELALARGERRLFVATARAGDDEMRARIAKHRADRGDRFETVEEPVALADAVRRAGEGQVDVVVIDCLTLWLSNLLCDGVGDGEVEERVAALATELARRRVDAVVVTNEVGLGIVPEGELGRRFRDLAGRAHQRLAREADELYLGAMGAMIRLKPAPVVALFGGAATGL